MPTTRGKAETKAYMRSLPEKIERRLLRGAARAAITVLKDEAADRVTSDAVREGLQTSVRKSDGGVVARLSIAEGWPRSLGNWLEYGTAPHVVSVDLGLTGGRTARRLNDQAKAGSLKIGGNYVGVTVSHPGSKRHPFMRVSLDMKGDAAIEAAQRYVIANVSRLDAIGADDGGDQ